MKMPPVLCAAVLLLATAHGETWLVEAGRFLRLHDVGEGGESVDTYLRAEAIDAVSVYRSGNKGDAKFPFKVSIVTRLVESDVRSNPEGWAVGSKAYTLDCETLKEADKAAAAILRACAGEAEEPEKRAEVVIDVLADGRLRVKGIMVDAGDLGTSLGNIVAAFPDQPVRIRADQETKYQDVTRVVELCQKAGIANISVGEGERRGVKAAPAGGEKVEK